MTALAIGLCLFCQLALVAGQLLLKHAMDPADANPRTLAETAFKLAGGIALLSLWFFLWLGLLRDWELSRLFPFEAVSQILLAFGAWLFLKERLSMAGWVGIALIGAGVTLVANG